MMYRASTPKSDQALALNLGDMLQKKTISLNQQDEQRNLLQNIEDLGVRNYWFYLISISSIISKFSK